MLSLIPIGFLAGVGMLWVFRRMSNQEAIRNTKSRLWACLFELLLFTDEPVLVWRAQRDLLLANARYMALMLVPALVLALPMILLCGQLECFYGLTPLPLGETSIVTVQMKQPFDLKTPPPSLEAPDGIAVETPAVRVVSERQVSWRIRALRGTSGSLRVVLPKETVEKKIEMGQGIRYLSDRRVSSILELLWHPAERRLPTGPVEWIEVRYPSRTIHWLGLDLHWLVCLLLISMASALVLKRRFRVSF
jgi:hypothetical protein